MGKPPLNLLVAYPYMNDAALRMLDELQTVADVRLLVDSGAFTAFKAGKTIQLDDYCAFLRALPVKPWRYITLDVVGDGEASRRNYYTMRDRGFSPVPVFFRGEPLEELDRYYETSDLVCVGGLAASKTSNPRPYLKGLMRHIGNRPVHLLGFTNMDWIKYLRPYSVDSSRWSMGNRYGLVHVYLGRGTVRQLSKQQSRARPVEDLVSSALRRLDYDPAALVHDDTYQTLGTGYTLAMRMNAANWIWCALDLEQRLGTRLFLATMGVSILTDAFQRAVRAYGWKETA